MFACGCLNEPSEDQAGSGTPVRIGGSLGSCGESQVSERWHHHGFWVTEKNGLRRQHLGTRGNTWYWVCDMWRSASRSQCVSQGTKRTLGHHHLLPIVILLWAASYLRRWKQTTAVFGQMNGFLRNRKDSLFCSETLCSIKFSKWCFSDFTNDKLIFYLEDSQCKFSK